MTFCFWKTHEYLCSKLRWLLEKIALEKPWDLQKSEKSPVLFSSHPCYKNIGKLSILRLPNPPIQPHWEKQLHLAQEACWIRGGFQDMRRIVDCQMGSSAIKRSTQFSLLEAEFLKCSYTYIAIYIYMSYVCMYSKGFKCCQSLSGKLKMASIIIKWSCLLRWELLSSLFLQHRTSPFPVGSH